MGVGFLALCWRRKLDRESLFLSFEMYLKIMVWFSFAFFQMYRVTSIACQQQMDEASAMQAVSDLASNQAISKEERIA